MTGNSNANHPYGFRIALPDHNFTQSYFAFIPVDETKEAASSATSVPVVVPETTFIFIRIPSTAWISDMGKEEKG
jgi:hypothetical protein